MGAVLLALAVLHLSACTDESAAGGRVADSPSETPTTSPTEVDEPLLEDPLDEITNRDSADFVSSEVSTVLHQRGTGPQVIPVEGLANVSQLRFYVSCTPDSEFTVTMGTFYSGPCSSQFLVYGAIPVPAGESQVTVDLDIPPGVDYWIVAVPFT
ncbi:hypothetical protein [uncultured Modestobacter sp.]|uniref:hypothetical protein n=1 Tax=uncultured Modestobacter sp. TaxID=380048 RepID=UPI002618B5E7|nr:hypothetical protein [uncultured Modestobacter sp.]